MEYPKIPELQKYIEDLTEYSRLKAEYGASLDDINSLLLDAEKDLKKLVVQLKQLSIDSELVKKEPDDLNAIKSLRMPGFRKMWDHLDKKKYVEKLKGAFIARSAGCTLGAPVEFWSVDKMENWARYTGDNFPPQKYWTKTKHPGILRYEKSLFEAYTESGMKGIPADDDLSYTILGLLIAEDHGIEFTIEDVGISWMKYLPIACTAEKMALENLCDGVDAPKAADINNPYCQWIGADIRSDPWAYMAPAWPEKAAELAYRDAFISHRRNGIYGEMFFSASQSAAFAVDDPIEAIKIGLTEIPQESSLYRDISWALETGKRIKDHKQARNAVDEHFVGMSEVHTNNNACLTVFGLMIGGTDVTRVISETVAMGLDNDCTAATAGSIVGAIVGIDNIPKHWYEKFNNKIITYINGNEEMEIDDVLERFYKKAVEIYVK